MAGENNDLVTGIGSAGAGQLVGNLTLTSTTKAFIPTRMTTTQRDALTGAAGMVIFNTTTSKLNVFTSAWEVVTSA